MWIGINNALEVNRLSSKHEHLNITENVGIIIVEED